MEEISYTLLSDGSSDRCLLPVINWLLKNYFPDCAINEQWADFRNLPKPPKKLSERISYSYELYPADILFIHRDAEKEPIENREKEVNNALKANKKKIPLSKPKIIILVPVRMQEAWILIDEKAIRKAAGNPNGQVKLNLPEIKKLEKIPDPKKVLHDLLRKASELKGRRIKSFNTSIKVYIIADSIQKFSLLRALNAFQHFEKQIGNLQKKLS